MKELSAVILAGGKHPSWRGVLADGCSWFGRTEYPALVLVNQKPMYRYVVEALQKAGIYDIVVVGEWTTKRAVGCCTPSAGGENYIGNLEAGLKAARNDRIILATCDLPALKPESITSFIEHCEIMGNPDIAYPIIPAKECERLFPGMKRTIVKLREDSYTGGNIFLLTRSKILDNLSLIDQLYKLRKNSVKLAGLFGWGTIAKLLAAQVIPGCLSVELLEKRASEMLGLSVKAVVAEADIGADIDTPKQLEAYLMLKRSA